MHQVWLGVLRCFPSSFYCAFGKCSRRTLLTILLLSDTAYSVWLTREASLALDEWAGKYLLSHQHIRAVHAEKAISNSQSAHDDSISTLVLKLNEQGWYVPRLPYQNMYAWSLINTGLLLSHAFRPLRIASRHWCAFATCACRRTR